MFPKPRPIFSKKKKKNNHTPANESYTKGDQHVYYVCVTIIIEIMNLTESRGMEGVRWRRERGQSDINISYVNSREILKTKRQKQGRMKVLQEASMRQNSF